MINISYIAVSYLTTLCNRCLLSVENLSAVKYTEGTIYPTLWPCTVKNILLRSEYPVSLFLLRLGDACICQ